MQSVITALLDRHRFHRPPAHQHRLPPTKHLSLPSLPAPCAPPPHRLLTPSTSTANLLADLDRATAAVTRTVSEDEVQGRLARVAGFAERMREGIEKANRRPTPRANNPPPPPPPPTFQQTQSTQNNDENNNQINVNKTLDELDKRIADQKRLNKTPSSLQLRFINRK